jgi:hypothetical protein
MIHSKKCFKCNCPKPLSEFYKHSGMADGYLNKCKICAKNDVNKHRLNNLEKIREYDRNRGKLPHRIKSTIFATKAWRNEDKKRLIAHSKVAYAIKKGVLLPQNCIRCNEEKVVAHHEDYNKPLEIVWLCQPCHKQRHKEILLRDEGF